MQSYPTVPAGSVEKTCERCRSPFTAKSCALLRGRGRFCGRRCANLSKPRRPLSARFDEKVISEPNSGCWLWLGATMRNGYGVIGLGGRADGTALAHRVAYQTLRGDIPDGFDLDHLCRNRACVNPDHLEPVTRRVNWERGMHSKAVEWRLSVEGRLPMETRQCRPATPPPGPTIAWEAPA